MDYFIFNYIGLIIGTIIVLPIVTEIVKRIPVVDRLVQGSCKKGNENIASDELDVKIIKTIFFGLKFKKNNKNLKY